MSLRIKLLALFTLTIAAVMGGMVWGVERYARSQFQESDQQRSDALVAQFRRELSQRGAEVSNSVQSIADAESTVRMVLELNRPQADPSVYANDARGLAGPRHLDFLELAADDGTLISSAHWPERVGYKNDWVTQGTDWNQRSAFLDRVELPNRVELGLLAVRMVHVGDRNFYIIGGRKLDSEFLRTLAFPTGMRALLYRNFEEGFVPSALGDADGPLLDAQPFAPVIAAVKKGPQDSEQSIQLTTVLGKTERFVTLPLSGRHGELLGALLLGSAQGQLTALVNYIHGLGLVIAAAGIFMGFLMSWWISARVARPLARLESGMAHVTAGDWDAQVEEHSSNEVHRVIRAFNKMTGALLETRSKQSARDRVSSWRELAGGLAGELSASISPALAATENLRQAHEETPEKADSGVVESLGEVRNALHVLQAEAQRLDDFASMPAPRLQTVNMNELMRDVVKSFEPQFRPSGRPPINPELFLDAGIGTVRADPGLLQTAVDNLLLHALADMPAGGTLSIRTKQQDGMVRMMLSDTGHGFEPKDINHRFSPSRKARGAGLGLAVAQAIVTDHGGRMNVESAPGAGVTVFLDLPIASAAPQAASPSFPPEQPKPETQLKVPTDRDSRPVAQGLVEVEAGTEVASELAAEEELPPAEPQSLTEAFYEPPSEVPVEVEAEVVLEVASEEDPLFADPQSSADVINEPPADPTAETEAEIPFVAADAEDSSATEPQPLVASTDERLAGAHITEALPIEARLEVELQAELESLAEAIFQSDATPTEAMDSAGEPPDTDGGQQEAQQNIDLSRPQNESEKEPDMQQETESEKEPEKVAAEARVERAWPPPLTYR